MNTESRVHLDFYEKAVYIACYQFNFTNRNSLYCPMRFTDWVSFNELEEAVPADSGLFQIKIRKGLLGYPQGKSAMFYYGYADKLDYGLLEFQTEILPFLEVSEEALLVRWMTVPNTEIQFRKHLNFFHANFGSLPMGNEMLLQKRAP